MVNSESCQQRALGLQKALLLEPDRLPGRIKDAATSQILFTWEFYPPARPHNAPKFQRLGENFIKPTLQLVTCNFHLQNYSNYLAISSNYGIFKNNSPNCTSGFKQ